MRWLVHTCTGAPVHVHMYLPTHRCQYTYSPSRRACMHACMQASAWSSVSSSDASLSVAECKNRERERNRQNMPHPISVSVHASLRMNVHWPGRMRRLRSPSLFAQLPACVLLLRYPASPRASTDLRMCIDTEIDRQIDRLLLNLSFMTSLLSFFGADDAQARALVHACMQKPR